MTNWKKIAVLFGFSVSAAVFGAACTSEVTPVDETQDLTDETAVVETSAEVTHDPPQLGRHEHGRRACEESCRDRYRQCTRPGHGHHHDSERQCRREREKCYSRCQHH